MNEERLNANLELKHTKGTPSRALVDAVVRELELLDPARELLVSSFNPLLLAEFHRTAPRWPVACLYENHQFAAVWRSVAGLLGATAIHPGVTGLERDRVRRFRAAGYDVNVWTVNSMEQAQELFDWGVTGVFTDVAQEFPAAWR